MHLAKATTTRARIEMSLENVAHARLQAGISRIVGEFEDSGMGGGEGGIRTHVPVTRQDAFEAPPLRPLRYLSGRVWQVRLKADTTSTGPPEGGHVVGARPCGRANT